MGTCEDDARVVYVFGTADDGFGFTFSIDVPDLSEWGYAP